MKANLRSRFLEARNQFQSYVLVIISETNVSPSDRYTGLHRRDGLLKTCPGQRYRRENKTITATGEGRGGELAEGGARSLG